MQTMTLKEWMDEKGYTNSSLAQHMDLSYAYLYMLTTEKKEYARPISASFEMRFIKCFGLDEASRVFGEIPQPESV